MRIRTLKPELWEDEAVGRLGPWERLLWIGAITIADDEGRFRALPVAIAGYVFPYEGHAASKVGVWLQKLDDEKLIVLYQADGSHYAQIRNWKRHQKIEKPTPSELPRPPADLLRDSSPIARRKLSDRSRASRASRSMIPSRSSPNQELPPTNLVPLLVKRIDEVLPILAAVQAERGGNAVTVRGVGLAFVAFPDRDHVAVARELEHWLLAGNGANRPVKDTVRTYRTFLDRSPAGSPSRPASRRPRGREALMVQHG